MENPPRLVIEVTITKELCDNNDWGKHNSCPIFQAAKAAGLSILSVGINRCHSRDDDYRIEPPFNLSDYLIIKESGRPLKLLLIKDPKIYATAI